jgi:hypothetical protein
MGKTLGILLLGSFLMSTTAAVVSVDNGNSKEIAIKK